MCTVLANQHMHLRTRCIAFGELLIAWLATLGIVIVGSTQGLLTIVVRAIIATSSLYCGDAVCLPTVVVAF